MRCPNFLRLFCARVIYAMSQFFETFCARVIYAMSQFFETCIVALFSVSRTYIVSVPFVSDAQLYMVITQLPRLEQLLYIHRTIGMCTQNNSFFFQECIIRSMGNNFVNLSLWLDLRQIFSPFALYADLKKISVINILSRLIVFFKINFLSVVLLLC